MMEFVILETKPRIKSTHSIFFNHLNLLVNPQGKKSAKLGTYTSSRHDSLLKKIICYFFRKEENHANVRKAMLITMFLEWGFME